MIVRLLHFQNLKYLAGLHCTISVHNIYSLSPFQLSFWPHSILKLIKSERISMVFELLGIFLLLAFMTLYQSIFDISMAQIIIF